MDKKKMLFLSLPVMLLWGSLFPMVKLGYAAFGVVTTANILFFAGGALYNLRCVDLSVLPDKRPAHFSAGKNCPLAGVTVPRVCDYSELWVYLFGSASTGTPVMESEEAYLNIPCTPTLYGQELAIVAL